MLALADLGQHTCLRTLALESAKCAVEGLVLANPDF
jgi:hypothetical protein